jgi:acyl-coenzyme A thioesterase PaaI-like protein
MRHEFTDKNVTSAQNISQMCLVCGEENAFGLHAHFFNLEDGGLCAVFETLPEHQSYPGRVHGGIISAMLDEVIGRAVQVSCPELFGVTMELNVKFRAPVPLGVPLKVVARIDKQNKRIFEGTGELVLDDGTVAAQGFGRYFAQDVNQISEGGLDGENWRPDPNAAPTSILA